MTSRCELGSVRRRCNDDDESGERDAMEGRAMREEEEEDRTEKERERERERM